MVIVVNKKGFTLIELLASMVLLAVIMAIAIPSINNLASSIRERHLENKIKNIEVAASNYAFDTKKTVAFVDNLIKEGYMDSDDEDGNVFNDTNHSKLNCYIVKMKKVGDHYNATFQDNTSYEKNGKCDESVLSNLNKELIIQVLQNGVEVKDYDNWLGGSNITLKAISNDLNIDCARYGCKWRSTSGHTSNSAETTINFNDLIVASRIDYNFEFNKMDENVRYNSSISLKIDNEIPTIYAYDTKVNSNNKLVVSASDNNGSGIAGYYIEQNGSFCSIYNPNYQESNEFDVTSGNYLICVKDKVGNINSLNITI